MRKDEYVEDYDEDLDLDNVDMHTPGELKKDFEVKSNEKSDYISATLQHGR
mgnify:CR=1 FL=1